MICGYKSNEGISAINSMSAALSSNAAVKVFNYSGTSVYINPRNGR